LGFLIWNFLIVVNPHFPDATPSSINWKFSLITINKNFLMQFGCVSLKEQDGTPYELKGSCTVWSRGKGRDHLKALPIAITI